MDRQACLPRKGESHPDTGQSLESCIFPVQQSGQSIQSGCMDTPLSRTPSPSPSRPRCLMSLLQKESLLLCLSIAYRRLGGSWKLMPLSFLWMHLWWTHQLRLPLILMISVAMFSWVWQAHKFATYMYFCWMLCHENFYVLMLGQNIICSFGHVALCAIWFMAVIILCFNE